MNLPDKTSGRRNGSAGLRRLGLLAALIVTSALVPIVPAAAVPDNTPIVIEGGGWGHGIGMPQWGAQGMADQGGFTYDQILAYWYSGTGLGTASALDGSPVPNPLRIGINYVLVGTEKQYRPFLWQDFQPIGGTVSICLPGEAEGSCSLTANPGETWRYRWYDQDGGFCAVTRNGEQPLYEHATACGVSLFWTDQPNVRVQFLGGDVARTFARGHIDFVGPVSRVWNGMTRTGFHLNVVLTLEEYIYGLAEVPVSWHMEALKSQVVAARTYGAWKARSGIRSDCSCHLVWDTSDQAYRGWHDLNEGNPTDGQRWRTAVDETAGQVVVYPAGSAAIAETYYFSSSGGATENVWDVWGPGTPEYQAKYAYLATRDDPWSVLYTTTPTEITTIRWRHTRTAGQIVAALAGGSVPTFPGLTEVISITIQSVNASGSPSDIEVTGVVGGQVVSKHFVSRAPTPDQGTIASLRTLLGLRGHYIYSLSGFLEPERWGGSNRYATAVVVSQQTHPAGANIVYLAVGTNHPDAIAAGPAAATEGAPILLVTAADLPAVTRSELQRLAPQRVVILGGEAAVSAGVADLVAAAVPGAIVERRAGRTRYETAVEVSKAVFAAGTQTVFVATGANFPDALVAAPAAALLGSPLLLVPSDGVPAAVQQEIQRLGPSRIVVVGGIASISESMFGVLSTLAPTVDRISARDRYAMSAAVSAAFFAPGTNTVYVAVGTDFPDALAGGPATGFSPGPVLFVQTTSLPSVVRDELTRLGPSRIVILGGPAAVSESLVTELAPYLE